MSFLAKISTLVEAKAPTRAINKAKKADKAKKLRGINKPTKAVKPTKLGKPVTFEKAGEATAAKPTFKATNFPYLKRNLGDLQKALSGVNITDFGDASWGKFYYLAAPKLLTYMLLDLGLVPREKIREVIVFFTHQTKAV